MCWRRERAARDASNRHSHAACQTLPRHRPASDFAPAFWQRRQQTRQVEFAFHNCSAAQPPFQSSSKTGVVTDAEDASPMRTPSLTAPPKYIWPQGPRTGFAFSPPAFALHWTLIDTCPSLSRLPTPQPPAVFCSPPSFNYTFPIEWVKSIILPAKTLAVSSLTSRRALSLLYVVSTSSTPTKTCTTPNNPPSRILRSPSLKGTVRP